MPKSKSPNPLQQHKHMIIPSGIGAIISWLFAGSFLLAALVFIGVWVGNLIGHSGKKK